MPLPSPVPAVTPDLQSRDLIPTLLIILRLSLDNQYFSLAFLLPASFILLKQSWQ